jgi:hypothetical protein
VLNAALISSVSTKRRNAANATQAYSANTNISEKDADHALLLRTPRCLKKSEQRTRTPNQDPERNASMELERITVLFATLTSAAYTAR